MKTSLAILALTAAAFTSQGQTTTNLDYRLQVETVTAGVTNKTTTNWRYDYGAKKDATRIEGANWAYAAYVTRLGTNGTPLAFGLWLKRQHTVLLDSYSDQKQAADNRVLLQKLTSLLTANSDLLTAGDLSSLSTIAAKAP